MCYIFRNIIFANDCIPILKEWFFFSCVTIEHTHLYSLRKINPLLIICLLFNPSDLLSKYYLLFVNYTENEIMKKIIYVKLKTESTKQVIDFKRIKKKKH